MKAGQGEQIYGATLRGPLSTLATSAANQWAGRTVLASNAATVAVSTNLVQADSLIFTSVQAHVNQASGAATPIEVKSINPGNHFILGTSDGSTWADRATTIMWMIARTGP